MRSPRYGKMVAVAALFLGAIIGAVALHLITANAGNLEPTLEFNPDGDEPTLVETPDEALPRLPTIGVRYRF